LTHEGVTGGPDNSITYVSPNRDGANSSPSAQLKSCWIRKKGCERESGADQGAQRGEKRKEKHRRGRKNRKEGGGERKNLEDKRVGKEERGGGEGK
jgi:hypothetical protein